MAVIHHHHHHHHLHLLRPLSFTTPPSYHAHPHHNNPTTTASAATTVLSLQLQIHLPLLPPLHSQTQAVPPPAAESSVKVAKKQTAGLLKGTTTTTTAAPQSLRRFLIPKGDGDDGEDRKGDVGGGGSEGETAVKGTLLVALFLVAVVGGFGSVGYIYKDKINGFLTQFSGFIEGYGAAGYVFFVAVYAGLEILAIPAISLTMSAGLLFGTFIGTIIVSLSGTIRCFGVNCFLWDSNPNPSPLY